MSLLRYHLATAKNHLQFLVEPLSRDGHKIGEEVIMIAAIYARKSTEQNGVNDGSKGTPKEGGM